MFDLFRILVNIYNFYYNKLVFFIFNVEIDFFDINGRIRIRNKGVISINKNFKAQSGIMRNPIGGDSVLRFIVKKGATLKIGCNVGISNSTIVCWSNIEIEDYVLIGGGCKIWDTDFHSLDSYERMHNGDNKVKTSPIKIKSYAFIGSNSIILKGVSIGSNSIVAAGSVVTRNIPDNEIWGGNPAKYIRNIHTCND